MTRLRVAYALAVVGLGVGLWFALTAPPDVLQGEYSRLLYIHVPTLWLAFLAFAVTSVASIGWLIRKRQRWDRVAAASVEIGVLFTAIGIAVGMIWGKAVWGVAWDWMDPRMATTAVMLFVYIGYLALRSATDDPYSRARRSAILGSIAVIQVPLVYFSVNMFRTLHQTQSIRPDGATMPDEMVIALTVNVAAFTLVYVTLLATRVGLARRMGGATPTGELAGAAVTPPRTGEIEDV
ncbi:MAG: cytochrome c biogenesis protein [Actinobacteria bacterium]|nr:cytochrome c biogenesis protein [Actinomycetota bacterium]MCI0677502.1 cytochrome c biogenesis protein [Actinomycetota bacterium]